MGPRSYWGHHSYARHNEGDSMKAIAYIVLFMAAAGLVESFILRLAWPIGFLVAILLGVFLMTR